MNTAMQRVAVVALLVVLAGTSASATLREPSELKLEPLAFTMPEGEELLLSNTIRVLVFENHDLPLVTLSAHVVMGKYYLPVERATAVEVLSRVWDEGGAGALPPEALDSLVGRLGMSLHAGIDDREAYVTAHMAREDLSRGAALWRDLLLDPRWDEERVARAKARKTKDLLSINDNPRSLARVWFWRLLAGPESAEGRVATRREIEAVTRDELLALHRRFVIPRATVIGLAGDITPDEARDLLEKLLSGWSARDGVELPEILPPVRRARPGVYLLPGDFEQCRIRIGRNLPGLTDTADDYPAVMIEDFGVGYMRVFYRTRQDGLSYGTGSRLIAGPFEGSCTASGSTRPEKVVELVRAVREEIDGMEQRPLTDLEVRGSRTFQLGLFIQKLERARDILRLRLREITLDLPPNYYPDLVASLQSVSPDEVAAAGKRWLGFGDNPVVLVVGTPEGGPDALEQLGLGEVHILEPIAFGE